MCTRYTLTKLDALAAFQDLLAEAADADWKPRYNVALTQPMPVITRRNGRAHLDTLHFGLTAEPRSAGERPLLLANARAETVQEKRTFREAVQHRRCLVPADGFYEWEKQGTVRLPHYFTLKEHQPFFFAGLWQPEAPGRPAGFCLVTTTPNPLLARIHDRMPVMLGPNSGPAWLGDVPLEPARIAQLCRPLPAEKMIGIRVDPRVNNSRFEAPDCVTAV